MTISTTASSVTIAGNGATNSFGYNFIAGTASNIVVTYTDANSNATVLVQGSQYTLSINAAAAGQIWGVGGTVTYPLSGSPIAAGTYLTISRIVPVTQLTSISNQGDFYPQAVERALDTLEMQIQQVTGQVGRALLFNIADTGPFGTLPISSVRAGKILGFDGSGNPGVYQELPFGSVSSAMAPVVEAASTQAAVALLNYIGSETGAVARLLLAKLGDVVSVLDFGATGNGIANDSPAFQSAINYCITFRKALYVPAASVYYLLNTALNLINIGQLLIYGDGCQPNPGGSTIDPGGSILAINTGGVGIDASGAAGLFFRDLTISSVGLANASHVGLVMSNSILAPGGGYNCGLENVTIALEGTGSSIPFYGVNVNVLSLLKVTTLGDFGLVILNANTENVTLPYGAYGANIQSDGVYSQGCYLNGYGTQAPFWLSNSNDGEHAQLYIHAANIGSGFTGSDYAMIIDTCNDLNIKVEIDGFPSAVLQNGTWVDIALTGIIFQGGTPLPGTQPIIASLQGTELINCRFGIRGLNAFPSNYWYSSNTTPTEIALIGCSFIFDTAISSLVASFDTTSTSLVPLFNLYMNGNQDAITNFFSINGSAMPASAYRVFINGLRTGTA